MGNILEISVNSKFSPYFKVQIDCSNHRGYLHHTTLRAPHVEQEVRSRFLLVFVGFVLFILWN